MSAMYSIAGLDIGGTSISWAVYESDDTDVSAMPIAKGSIPTGKGNPGFQLSVREAVNIAQSHCPEARPLRAVGIGMPGRYIGPDHAIAAPHTAHNLCLPEDRTAFDNQPLKHMLREHMPKGVWMAADNDAVVQMLGLLQLHEIDEKISIGEMVGYIGPGTGLGGGFARKTAPMLYDAVTDGHINHVLLKLEPEDHSFVQSIEKERGITFPGRDGRYTAEGLFCGTGLEQLCGLPVDGARELDKNEKLRNQHLPELKLIGRVLAKLMQTLHSGNFEKLNPADTWPKEDQALASDTTKYLFAGGMGHSTHVAPIIREEALSTVRYFGLSRLELIPTQSNPTTLAAARMAHATLAKAHAA